MQRANNLLAQLSRIRLINVKAMESTPVRLHIALIPGFLNQIVSSSTLKVKNANLVSYTTFLFISNSHKGAFKNYIDRRGWVGGQSNV